ncbi:MAG: hypothetical protein GF313_04165 [Caldithrix sp.]|nr:hypothetical protein [Caldithrix sp.]
MLKMGMFAVLGGIAGFAYYYFIGCATNSCPITSNPYITVGYGLGAGLLLGWDTRKTSRKKSEQDL